MVTSQKVKVKITLFASTSFSSSGGFETLQGEILKIFNRQGGIDFLEIDFHIFRVLGHILAT